MEFNKNKGKGRSLGRISCTNRGRGSGGARQRAGLQRQGKTRLREGGDQLEGAHGRRMEEDLQHCVKTLKNRLADLRKGLKGEETTCRCAKAAGWREAAPRHGVLVVREGIHEMPDPILQEYSTSRAGQELTSR